ncbi:MAG: thioredoxin domain-containing protein [Minisyncoccota bacterium]
MEQNTKNKYGMPVAIVIAGLLIAIAVYSSSSKNTNTALVEQPHQQEQEIKVDIANVQIDNEPFIGNQNAPVTIAYWSDFQCPFCKRFDLETLPTLVKNYVDTGKLKVVFKDFQFLGPDSEIAGHASKAVWELYPDLYYKWHQAMYEAQDEEHGGFGDKESIIKLTRTIPGIDADKVSSLMEENKTNFQQEQDEDKQEASQFGINGTPGFVIGTQVISGAQPVSIFTQLIGIELNK